MKILAELKLGWIKAFFIHARGVLKHLHIQSRPCLYVGSLKHKLFINIQFHAIQIRNYMYLRGWHKSYHFYLYCVSHIKVKMFTIIAQPMYAWVVAFKVWISMNLIKKKCTIALLYMYKYVLQLAPDMNLRKKKIHPWLPVEKINLRKKNKLQYLAQKCILVNV